jgi:phosphatidylglycerophosphate synthase
MRKYLSNYLVVVMFVSLVLVLFHPFHVLALVGTAFVAHAITSYARDRAWSVVVGSLRIDARHVGMTFGAIIAALAVVFFGEAIFFLIGISSSVVFSHALLRHVPDGPTTPPNSARSDRLDASPPILKPGPDMAPRTMVLE